jgi:hypothetical protein
MAVFVPLIGFGLYRRVRRTFGPQPVAPRRMALRMALLTAVGVLFLATSPFTALSYGAAFGGLAVGVALAFVGLAHTTFDTNDRGKFYVPNKWIGLSITALFLGRLAARLFTVSEHAAQVAPGTSPFAGVGRSPFTLGLFFLLAGYYVAYYAGVLKRSGAQSASEAPPK